MKKFESRYFSLIGPEKGCNIVSRKLKSVCSNAGFSGTRVLSPASLILLFSGS
ncbi:MAG: hypothetical protein KKB51_01765 [Candidatus Riflebacteria bacterium]|nr:hypothetical protein [Candidatus Riflebacteria bacterium]